MDEEARALGSGPARLHGPPRRNPWSRRWPPGRDGAPRGGRGPTYAALDLGTNNCRLLVARPTEDSFRVVDAFSRIIRLGEGVSTSGVLNEGAIARAIEALSVCRDKMVNRSVTRARLIATEACRAAANGSEFLTRVREHVGIELEIVDRETEALLAATGCTPLMDPRVNNVLLFDIGGGSSELVRLGRSAPADGGPPVPTIRGWASLPVGVVTLAERHGGVRVDRALFETMIAEVAVFVERFAAAHGRSDADMHMLGTSGTVTTICGVHLGLRRYDRRQVDGCWMHDDQVTLRGRSAAGDDLRGSRRQRAASAASGRTWCSPAVQSWRRSAATFPCTRLRIADRGLREGMLVQMMRQDGVWRVRRARRARRANAHEIA